MVDKECRFKRHELRKLANQKHRDPLNAIIREEYHVVLKQYKTLLNNTKSEYYNNKDFWTRKYHAQFW